MANPDPSPKTRFQKGENGRQKKAGDRDRLTAKFLFELAEDFDANGKEAIATLRQNDPGRYIAAVVALVPKQVEVQAKPLQEMDDSKLTQAIETLTDMLRVQIPAKDDQRASLN